MAAETMEMMNSMIPAISNREFQAIEARLQALFSCNKANASIVFDQSNIQLLMALV